MCSVVSQLCITDLLFPCNACAIVICQIKAAATYLLGRQQSRSSVIYIKWLRCFSLMSLTRASLLIFKSQNRLPFASYKLRGMNRRMLYALPLIEQSVIERQLKCHSMSPDYFI